MNNFAFHEAIPGYFEDLGDQLWLKLALFGEQPEQVLVRIEPDNEEFLIPMQPEHSQHGWTFYSAKVIKSEHIEQTLYLFKMLWAERSLWLTAAGVESHMPRNIHMFRYSHDQRFPSWATSQVFYQVFPERFANGNAALTPTPAEYKYLGKRDIVVKDWHEAPTFENGPFEFFGGDLPGLQNKLSYLQEQLGVTALYLNPVFSSQSNHKYDTTDYFNVDPHFGGNEALVDLVTDMKQRNMKLVLDAVINHTSLAHPWFVSGQHGDKRNKARYCYDADGKVESWKGHGSLPVLDFSNEDNLNDLVLAEDSVIRHWLRAPYQIDGWRMDVIHMIGAGKGAKNNAHYIRQLRDVIKQENSEAMLLGEHFFEATDWLQGDQEDCAMNYFGFAHPIRAFLANLDIALHPVRISGFEFAKWTREARARVSFQHQLMQFNQLDSHDTPRFLSMLKGNRALMKVAIGFLMSYIGTPCLYYGTEIGLVGEGDPDCRRPFPWDETEWDGDLFSHTQQWIAWRKEYAVLQQGAIQDLFASDNSYIFGRVLGKQAIVIAMNRGETESATFECHLPGAVASVQPLDAQRLPTNNQQYWEVELPAQTLQAWLVELV